MMAAEGKDYNADVLLMFSSKDLKSVFFHFYQYIFSLYVFVVVIVLQL